MVHGDASMIRHFEEMLITARSTGNLARELMALENLAGQHQHAGDYMTAVRYWQEAVDVGLANNALEYSAQSLDKLSDLYAYKLGDRRIALGYLEEAVRIAPEGQLKQRLGETLERARISMGLTSG